MSQRYFHQIFSEVDADRKPGSAEDAEEVLTELIRSSRPGITRISENRPRRESQSFGKIRTRNFNRLAPVSHWTDFLACYREIRKRLAPTRKCS